MGQFARFPNVQVFALPVEHWPAAMKADFDRLFQAQDVVRRTFGRYRRANALVRSEGSKAIMETEDTWREKGAAGGEPQ